MNNNIQINLKIKEDLSIKVKEDLMKYRKILKKLKYVRKKTVR